jgi:hypothetical protein
MDRARVSTGILLVVVPLVFVVGFAGLGAVFDYPQILRRPASEVLSRFADGGATLRMLWYMMAVAALGLIPIAIGTALLWWRRDPYLAALSAGFGVVAGLVQALGLMRWVFLVPVLAGSPAAGIDDAGGARIYDAANAYLGAGIGEHLGYLFTSLWTAAVAGLLWSRWRWLAGAGFVLASGIAFGMLEPAGVPSAVAVNAIAFSAWTLWLLVFGVLTLRSPATNAESLAIPA